MFKKILVCCAVLMLATPALPDGSTFSNNFATKTETSRENLLASAEGGNLVSAVSGQTDNFSSSGPADNSSSSTTSEDGTTNTQTTAAGTSGLSDGDIGAIAGSLGGLVAAGVGVAGYVAFKRRAQNKLAEDALAPKDKKLTETESSDTPSSGKKTSLSSRMAAPFRAIREKASALTDKVAQWNAKRKANKALLAQLTPPPASGTSMTAKVKSFLSSAGSFFSRKKTTPDTPTDKEHNAATFLQTRFRFLQQRNTARTTKAAGQIPVAEVVPDATAPVKVKTRKAQAKADEALSPADETALATERARMFGHDDALADGSPSGGDATVVHAPVTVAPDHAVVAADGDAAARNATRTAGDKKPAGDEPVAADSSPRIVVSGLHADPVPTAEDEAARLAAVETERQRQQAVLQAKLAAKANKKARKAATLAEAADQSPTITPTGVGVVAEEDNGLATRRAKETTRPQLIGASGAATIIQRFMRAKIAKKPTVAAPPQEDSVIVVSGEGKKIVAVSGDAFVKPAASEEAQQRSASFAERSKKRRVIKSPDERAAAEETRKKADAERAAEKQAREKARAERREKIAAQREAEKAAVYTAKKALLADLRAKFASKETPSPERDAGDVAPRADAPVDAPTTDGRAIPRVKLAPLRPVHPTTPDEVKADADLLVARTSVVDRAPSPEPEPDSPLQTSRAKQTPQKKRQPIQLLDPETEQPVPSDSQPTPRSTPKDKVASRVGQPKPLTTRPSPGVISLEQGGIALPASLRPRGKPRTSGHQGSHT